MNRLILSFLLVSASFILSHCSAPLERQAVPVYAGISIDSTAACPRSTLAQNRDIQHASHLRGWSVEIPMLIRKEEATNAFVYYEGHSLDTLLSLLAEKDIPYILNFSLQNPFALQPEEISPDRYLTDVTGLLLRTSHYPPEVIGFMGSFLDKNLMGDRLSTLVREMKKGLPSFSGQIVFAGVPEVLAAPGFDWDTPDAVGILYLPPGNQVIKPYFRDINQRLSPLFIYHQKPLYILQSNLVGDEKLLVFKNQLRFWEPEVDVQGIVLNSLYCHVSLIDSVTPFSLANDRAFGTYLQEYVGE